MTINVLETSDLAKEYIRGNIKKTMKLALKPPPVLNMIEWAQEYRVLPDNSAEPGPWNMDRMPPARAPMLSASDPDVKEITIMACIQALKTEFILNTCFFFIHQEPSPILFVLPKKEMAESVSKERFTKGIMAMPELRELFANNRRGDGNTITQKLYPGGQISFVSARNPDDLASRACRILLFDEIDKYESDVKDEGDPIAVAWGRSTTFGDRAKKICACSPTVEGKSRIQMEYNKSNMSVYLQKCPHCDHMKELQWLDVVIPKDEKGNFMADDAAIVCSECGVMWDEGDRLKSIDNGEWLVTKPEVKHHHGYKMTSLASTFTPVLTLVREFIDAGKNSKMLKAFYNTRMAQTWKEIGDQPDWKRLYERRENYKVNIVQDGGLMVTMGMDIQKYGVFYETVAWGRRKESWSVDKAYMTGDIEDQDFRDQIYALWDTLYVNSVGMEMMAEKICVDSGYNTQAVYALVRGYHSDRVVAIKGEDNLKTPIGTPTPVDVNIDGQRLSKGLMLWKVGSSVIKEQIYSWLNQDKPTDEKLEAGAQYPSGYSHFPEYDEEFFKQLTAEQYLRQEDTRGFVKYVWEKTRADNHFLDCRVYARAGASMLQIDRMTDVNWLERENIYHPKKQSIDSKTEVNDTVVNKPRKKRRTGSWIKR